MPLRTIASSNNNSTTSRIMKRAGSHPVSSMQERHPPPPPHPSSSQLPPLKSPLFALSPHLDLDHAAFDSDAGCYADPAHDDGMLRHHDSFSFSFAKAPARSRHGESCAFRITPQARHPPPPPPLQELPLPLPLPALTPAPAPAPTPAQTPLPPARPAYEQESKPKKLYIITDEQWAQETTPSVSGLRQMIIEASYFIISKYFKCLPSISNNLLVQDARIPGSAFQHAKSVPPATLACGPEVAPAAATPGNVDPSAVAPPAVPPYFDVIYSMVQRTRTPLNAIALALLYIRRLRGLNPLCSGSAITPHRVMTAAIILACKFLYDDSYSNITWSHVSHGLFTISEINTMEWEFLHFLRYQLSVSRSEWVEFLGTMDKHLTRSFTGAANNNCTGGGGGSGGSGCCGGAGGGGGVVNHGASRFAGSMDHSTNKAKGGIP